MWLKLGLGISGGVVLSLGLMSGCSSSTTGGGAIACDDAGACPNGLTCQQGACVDPGTGGGPSGGGGGPNGGGGGPPVGGGGSGNFGGGPPVGGGGGPPVGGGGGSSCDPTSGEPGDCTALDPTNACQVCIQNSCCVEYGHCTQSPDDNCAWGGPDGNGEVFCFQECVFNAGLADPTTQANCAASCTTPGCGTISSATNDLIGCLNNSCFAECLQVGG